MENTLSDAETLEEFMTEYERELQEEEVRIMYANFLKYEYPYLKDKE